MSVTISGDTGVSKVQDGVIVQADLASGVAGNGPTFWAWQSTAINPSSNTATKIPINTIEWDTNSCFNTTTNRFTPNVAGYYQFNGVATIQGSSGTSLVDITISKNGGAGIQGVLFYDAGSVVTTIFPIVTGILYMNGTTDYVELNGRVVGTGTLSITNGGFSGVLVRAA